MADSIKLLQFFQKCYRNFFGIRTDQPNQKQNSTNSIQTIFFICLAQITFTTVAFILFKAKSLFDYGFSFFLLICIVNAIVVYFIFIWKSQNAFEFIGNCEEFIEKRPHSTAAYKEPIEKIELFNKILCFAFSCTASLALLSVPPLSFARYYIFDLGEDSFYLFLPAWFPFDWKKPFGYLVAWLAQCAGHIATASVIGQFLNLVFGSCWLFIFIAEDITQDVVAFNIAAKTTSHENRTELRKCFCNMVQIHSDAKQRVTEFNQLSKYSLFAFLAWDMLGASGLLATIQFDLWADDTNLLEIAILIVILIWMIVIIFLLCEPGARTSHQFEEFSDELNRCDWYLLPMEFQQCYIIFLSDTQNPINVMSYANIVCERETSKKIIFKAWSYFMTLRNFKP